MTMPPSLLITLAALAAVSRTDANATALYANVTTAAFDGAARQRALAGDGNDEDVSVYIPPGSYVVAVKVS